VKSVKSKEYLIFFIFLGGIIGILFPPFLSLAVDVGVFTDVLPFPAPTGLTATVISPFQIDLNWFPVITAVSYKVYRDGIVVGLPATASFSDVGLTPSTTYTYTVSAVNIFGGESPKSSPVPATTFATGPPVIPPPSPPGVVVEPSPDYPEVPKSLIVNDNNNYTTSLGVTLSLSAENAFQMAISNQPDFVGGAWELYQTSKKWTLTEGDGEKTVYAKFRSQAGGVSEVVADTIILDTTPPANVINFEAIAADSKINLTWQNPPEPDFKAVKIMRSTDFYPATLEKGILIYNGKGTAFSDAGLINGVRYYYTAFSYDKAGNYASGATASAVPQKPLLPEEKPPEILPPPEKIPPVVSPPPEIEKLALKDFDFWQEDKKIPLTEEEKIKIKTEKPFTISIPYQSVPEVLKTIMVTLEEPARPGGGDRKTFSFLLRINQEKTAYLATLIPSERTGVYSLTIITLDFKNQVIKKIFGQLEIEKPEKVAGQIPWCKKIIDSILNWLYSTWQSIKNLLIFL
jgi:hypothetical protein